MLVVEYFISVCYLLLGALIGWYGMELISYIVGVTTGKSLRERIRLYNGRRKK